MDKQYKPLTPPDKRAYEPFVKPKFVDDTVKPKYTGKFKKKAKARPLVRICEKCHNIISDDGDCWLCGHQNKVRLFKAL